VYLDGVLVRTVDLRADAADPRRVVFSTSWAAPGTHTLLIRPVGTVGRPRIDIDGLILLGRVTP
jgi:hypothetical protein